MSQRVLAAIALTVLAGPGFVSAEARQGTAATAQAPAGGETRWTTIERPSQFGKDRDKRYREYDEKYGKGNWRLVWEVGGSAIDRDGIVMLYEDAYYFFFKSHPDALERLLKDASDVYDDAPSNVTSGLDYDKQETDRTHLQDISIRRVVIRLGRAFTGKQLVQIRDTQGSHPLSVTLSPGQVPFHMPELIKQPEATGWWKPGTVESFYQSNRVLQVKRSAQP